MTRREFDWIARYLRPLARNPASLGLADDAAILSAIRSEDLVLTKDMLVRDVHFFADDAAQLVARKALRVNLSDLAAMGARPRGYLLGLALPGETGEAFLQEFVTGLAEDQTQFALELWGGDIVRSTGPLIVSVTMIGSVPGGRCGRNGGGRNGGGRGDNGDDDTGQGTAVRRNGARAGDVIVVTGTLGDAALGLDVRRAQGSGTAKGGVSQARAMEGLSDTDRDYLKQRYLLPQPRLEAAPVLRQYANAAIDISDGLVADAGHICAACSLSACIDLDRLPLSGPAMRLRAAHADFWDRICGGGDDYEILACVPPEHASAFCAALNACGPGACEIGHMTGKPPHHVSLRRGGAPVQLGAAPGFRHF